MMALGKRRSMPKILPHGEAAGRASGFAVAGAKKMPLFWCLAIMIFFCPSVLEYYSGFTVVIQVLAACRYIVSFFAIAFMILQQHDRPIVWLLALYQLSVILSAANLGEIYLSYALSCMTFLGFVALNIEAYRRFGEKVIDFYYWLMFAYLLLNFMTEVIYPDGMVSGLYGDNRVWFLGVKNKVTLFYALFACTFFIRKSRETGYNAITADTVPFVVITATLFLIPSSTALVIAAMSALYYAWIVIKKDYQVSIVPFLAVISLFFIGVVILGGTSFLTEFVSGLFGKTATFSGRQAIWGMALDLISKNPFGSGLDVELNPWGNRTLYVYSAHNTLLDIAVRTGVICAAIFAIAFVAVCLMCGKSPAGSAATCFLLFAGIASMMEAVQSSYQFWALLAICVAIHLAESNHIPALRGMDERETAGNETISMR